jgi:predicted Zn-dependent protease with MMP-like domain
MSEPTEEDSDETELPELERAWDLLDEGDFQGARKAATSLQAQAPDHPAVNLLLAALSREDGDVEATLAHLARASAGDPEWATPELWAAEMLSGDPDRLAEALGHATRGVDRADEEDEFLEAVAVKAGIEMDLGRLAAARKTLSELPPAEVVPEDIDPAWSVEIGHLFLALGEAGEARARFTAVTAKHDLSDAWYGAGMAAEATGDNDGRGKAWLRTLELDELEELDDPHLSEEEMAEVAEAALSELPAKARTLIENVPIVIADLPAREDVEKGLDPRLLGLFEGTAYSEGSTMGGTPHLARIVLFRKNLERVSEDEDEMSDEIRTTLLHETGHFFGMSEEDLAGVGLD